MSRLSYETQVLPLVRRSEDVFPWLRELDAEQLGQFYFDLFSALRQALQERSLEPVAATLESWQATAEVLADADLTAILTEPTEADEWENWDDVETTLFDTAA